METWINAVATFLGIIVASIISVSLYRSDKQNASHKEAFDKFYAPYVLIVYEGVTMADYSCYIRSKQREICLFLKANIQYADAKVQKLIYQFSLNQTFDSQNDSSEPITGRDIEWNALNKIIFSKYEELCDEFGCFSLLDVHL